MAILDSSGRPFEAKAPPLSAPPNVEKNGAVVTRRYTELPQYSFTGFDTVDQCKAAIRNLEQGRFDLAVQLCGAMTRDDRLAGALDLRCQGIDALPLTFKEGKGAMAADVSAELQTGWTTFFPKPELQKLRMWGHMIGIGLAENRWEYNPETKRLEPRLHTWHPRFLWWNWGSRSFWLNTMEGAIELSPTSGQWVFYTPHGLGRGGMFDATAAGLVRSLYVPWLLRQWAARDSGRYGEAFGSVTKKARFPAGINDNDRAAFMNDVASLGSESVIGLASSPAADGKQMWDVEFMEVEGTGGELFQKTIDQWGSNIAIRIIGNNLTTEVKGGSYAAAFVHEHIRQDIIEDDTDSLALCLKTQSIEPWARFNFGGIDVAPTACWHTAPPEDTKAAGESLEAFGTGVAEVVLAGIPLDVEKLAAKHGVPLREDATDEEKQHPLPIRPELLAQGVPSVNAALERLGQEAVEGGDDLPDARKAAAAVDLAKAKPALGAGPGGKGKGEKKMNETEDDDEPTTAVEAQLDLDALADETVKRSKDGRVHEVAMLMAVIEHAVDFDDLKRKLTVCYAKMDDKNFESVLKKALAAAELMGRDFARSES